MLRENLQNTLKEAMKEKNLPVVSTVRMIIAGIKEKDVEARGKGKKEADETELLAMMQTMIKQRKESIHMYNEGHRPELASKEEAEINIIERFLPQQLNKEQIENVLKEIIKQTGAQSLKDMGKIMGLLRNRYAGQMDFSVASETIKEMLS